MYVARLLQNRDVVFVSDGAAWYDYIPVIIEGTVKDSTAADGYIEVAGASGASGVRWADYIPVKIVAEGTRWSYNTDGYIPIQFASGDEGFSDATYVLEFAGTASLTPVIGTTAPTVTRAGNTATRVNSSGLIEVVNANLPRFDYNPSTRECKGLLIEDARTNLVLNSATLVTQEVTVAAVAHTLSFYGTGTVTLSGVSTAGPLVGTGAYPTRVSLTFTPTAGTLTLTVSGSVTFAQLEAGGFVTSYIPTVGSAVARNADRVILTTANLAGYVAGTGTIVSNSITPPAHDSGGQVVWELGDGTGANRVLHYKQSGGALVGYMDAASVNQASFVYANPPTASALTKSALAWATNDLRGGYNGSQVVGDTSATVPTFTQLVIGGLYATGFEWGGHIQQLAYYPSRLSNTRLAALTA